MKKAIFLATALSVAMTSFTALAAGPMFSFATDKKAGTIDTAKINRFGVYPEDEVAVAIDAASRFKGDTEFQKSITRSARTADIENQVTLDMTAVTEEWEAFIDTAAEKAAVLVGMSKDQVKDKLDELIDLDAEFNMSVVLPNGVTASTEQITWSPETDKCFTGRDYKFDEATNTYSLVMKAEKTRENNTNIVRKFFESKEVPTVTVLGGKVSSTGTYVINAAFSGSVTISMGDTQISKVTFPETKSDTTVILTSGGRNPGEGGGGSTGVVSTPKPVNTPTPTKDPEATDKPDATEAPTKAPDDTEVKPTPVPEDEVQDGGIPSSGAALNYNDHFAYIIGYPEGDVRPENNITRAEVATIFFRLLTNESREKLWTKTNDFTDVKADDWFNNAISTVANAGIVKGYEDGSFRPNAPITRAEFAAIASRFSSKDYTGEDKFTDISTHWARNAINRAAIVGWVNGYEDGTFKPDTKIKRSEAMTLINRVTYRLITKEGMEDKVTMEWIDNPESKWYYVNVMEATDSHDYTRERIGAYETWKAENPALKWDDLEKVYSNVGDVKVDESNLEKVPDTAPTTEPEAAPTEAPTGAPEAAPTEAPTEAPTAAPSK